MNRDSPNDKDVDCRAFEPDAAAYGQTALLLIESLIHSLIAHSVISVAEAIDVVETAAEVKEDIAIEQGDSPVTLQKSLIILKAISTSLSLDLPPKNAR